MLSGRFGTLLATSETAFPNGHTAWADRARKQAARVGGLGVCERGLLVSRPAALESRRRTREFVRLVVAGVSWDAAADAARVNPRRALRILFELEGSGVVTVGRERAA